jgi:hypothetical protein
LAQRLVAAIRYAAISTAAELLLKIFIGNLALKQALTELRVAPLASPPTQYAALRVLALLRSSSASRTRGLRDLEQLLALKSA